MNCVKDELPFGLTLFSPPVFVCLSLEMFVLFFKIKLSILFKILYKGYFGYFDIGICQSCPILKYCSCVGLDLRAACIFFTL